MLARPRLNSPIARKLDEAARYYADQPRPSNKPASIIRRVVTEEERERARWRIAFERAEARAREEQRQRQEYEDAAFAIIPHRRTCREIMVDVAKEHGFTLNDIVSECRNRRLVLARHEAMYRCMMETETSFRVSAA